MTNRALFTENTRMADVVLANGRLLGVLPYFGIDLGFGEKTLGQVCAERGVSAPLVLLVCNLYTFDDFAPEAADLKAVPVEGIVGYLEASHRDYLHQWMPRITAAVLALPGGELLAAFCEKYRREVVAHFRYEEQTVFPHIRRLLAGERPEYRISEYETHHSDIDGALDDLTHIIVKYLPPAATIEVCRPVLADLLAFAADLRRHTLLEETILIPMVERLDGGGRTAAFDGVELTEREGEVLAALARGLSNKAIGERLHISPHTVISHRKNIMRKTGFKTAQGLTFFALHSGLVSLDDFR